MFTIENLKYPEKAKSRKYNLQSYLPVIITINILISSTYLSPIVGHLGYFQQPAEQSLAVYPAKEFLLSFCPHLYCYLRTDVISRNVITESKSLLDFKAFCSS